MATNVAQLVVSITSDTRMLTRGLNLAAVAVAGFAVASVKAATDYDQAFTKIAAVSNASARQVAGWREEVMGLAGETARAPQELADALYFLASAGLDANEIMPALEASAKAAAAGLGETSDIARLTANVLNAYAGSGIKAADVTDTLVAAVREGTAEPNEFADAMGRILPIASKAGVSFDEVAASLSSLSNIGLDVNEGVTAMRGVLNALEAPGTQAAETLHDIGISAEEMRDVISEEGILGALRLLEERTHGNIDVIRDIIPNIRALTGMFGLTGQEAEKVSAIFDHVRDSTGSLSDAFDRTRKGAAFKFQQAMTEFRVAMIKVGNILLPIATKIANVISSIADAFSDLSPSVQDAIVKIGLFALALKLLSPLLAGLGLRGAAAGIVGIGGAAAGASGGLTALAGSIASLAQAAAVIGIAGYSFQVFEDLTTSNEELAKATGLTVDNVAALDAQLSKGMSWANPFSSQADKVREAGTIASEVAKDLAETLDISLREAVLRVNGLIEESSQDLGGWTGSMDTLEQNLRGRLGLLELADAITLVDRRWGDLMATFDRGAMTEALGGGAASPFDPKRVNEFVASLISLKDSGLDVDEVFGDQMRAAIDAGTVSWARLTHWFERAGVAMPYQRAGRMAQAIFLMDDATVKQRGHLADVVALLNQEKIVLSEVADRQVDAAVAQGDTNAALDAINTDVLDEVVSGVEATWSSLNRQQQAWIANAIASGDYLGVLTRIEQIEKRRAQEAEQQYRKGFKPTPSGEFMPTAAMGAPARQMLEDVDALLATQPKLRGWGNVLRNAIAGGIDTTKLDAVVTVLDTAGVKWGDLSEKARDRIEFLVDHGKFDRAVQFILGKVLEVDNAQGTANLDADASSGFAEIDRFKSALNTVASTYVASLLLRTEGGSTAFDLIDHFEARMLEVTEKDWRAGLYLTAPSSLGASPAFAMAGGEPVPATGQGGTMAVVLDRRRFTETADFDATYRGY